MRPNKSRMIGRVLVGTSAAVIAASAAAAGVARADVAYMNGVGGIGPRWDTVVLPDGTAMAGAQRVRYDNVSTESAARAAGEWMDAHNGPDDVLVAFSLAGPGAQDARALRPDWQGTLVAVGSPSTPGNGNSYLQGGRDPLPDSGGPVRYVSSQGDSVARPGTGGSVACHVRCYNRDLSAESPVSDGPGGQVFADPPRKSLAERRAERRQAVQERRQAVREARAERRAARSAAAGDE